MTQCKEKETTKLPEHLKQAAEEFFHVVDAYFPNQYIIWKNWDHELLDRQAAYLCQQLGYQRGAAFLTAYGYTIETEEGLIVPEKVPETAADENQQGEPHPAAGAEGIHSGCIFRILPNGNSGFVRDDQGGDYYFNVRSFRHWVDELQVGQRVCFRVEERMDHRKKQWKKTAVSLYYP